MHYKFAIQGRGSKENAKNILASLIKSGGQCVNDATWQLLWILTGEVPKHLYSALGNNRIINRIPSIDTLYRKAELSESLEAYFATNPSVKRFHPLTLNLATQRADIERRVNDDLPGSWILKPRIGSCGNNIRVIRDDTGYPTR